MSGLSGFTSPFAIDMASNKKIERAVNGPGFFEITFGVLLSVILGALLGVLHLVFKPVVVTAKPVDGADPKQVYLIEGSTNSAKARQWMRKRQMLADGAAVDVSFSEEELNAWMAGAVSPQAKGSSTGSQALFTPERVNFRIRDDAIQMGLMGKLSVAGFSQDMVFQSRGRFAPGPAGFVYNADELYVGSFPVHKVPGAAPYLISKIIAAQELPEDLAKNWSKLKLVAVEGNALRMVLP